MIRFENTLEIEQPVDLIYDFMADLENLPKWNYFVTRVSHTGGEKRSTGATYHQVRKNDEQDLKIAEMIPNQILVIETIPPSKPELRRKMIFEPANGATKIIDRWDLDTGHPGLLQKLAGRRVRSAVKENLDKLKTLLEDGSVTLQDGRTATHSV